MSQSQHNTRSSNKKKRAADDNGNVDDAVVVPPVEPKSPPKRLKENSSRKGGEVETESAFDGDAPENKGVIVDPHNQVVQQLTRFLTTETTEAAKGRVWMAANGQIFAVSDDLRGLTDLGVVWIEGLVNSDTNIDAESIYITACDSAAAAMNMAHLQGATYLVDVPKREPSDDNGESPAKTIDASFSTPVRLVLRTKREKLHDTQLLPANL